METTRIETMSLRPLDAMQKERQRATKVADQFEAVFVRTLVGSLRQTATLGGESMFGSGPGADTYGDWFDQNLAEEIGRSGRLGIGKQIVRDFERDGAIEKVDVDEAAAKVRAANQAQNRNAFAAVQAAKGGFDVLL